MSEQQCKKCDKVVHTTQNGLTTDLCTEHFLEKMSDLRPNGEFEPQ